MIFFIKGLIRRFKYILLNIHHKDVQRYISYFDKKDFQVIRNGNSYKILFDNSLGYLKENYEPEFSYNFWTNHWVVKFQDIEVKTLINPCFELICEWRGYTLKKTPQKGDTVIDAGAATGFISLLFAKKVGKNGKVFALEPDKRMSSILNYNIKINHLENIISIPKGLYGENGAFSFDPSTLSLKKNLKQNKNTIETIDLKTLIKNYTINVSKLSIIKLDIEGAEVDMALHIGSLIAENSYTMATIASYHQYEDSDTGTVLNQFFKTNFPQLKIISDYSIHPTTYIYKDHSQI